jgi:Recombination endonuclease VII
MTAKDKRDRLLYNLLPGEREKIARFQNYKDPITGYPLKARANLDHDHTSGLCRGLLNPLTNKRLVDDLTKLKKMETYLLNPPAVIALGEKVYGLIGRAKRKKTMLYGPAGTPLPQTRSVNNR